MSKTTSVILNKLYTAFLYFHWKLGSCFCWKNYLWQWKKSLKLAKWQCDTLNIWGFCFSRDICRTLSKISDGMFLQNKVHGYKSLAILQKRLHRMFNWVLNPAMLILSSEADIELTRTTTMELFRVAKSSIVEVRPGFKYNSGLC